MDTVKRATGCNITARQLEKGKKEYDVRDYGAGSEEPPAANAAAINRAIELLFFRRVNTGHTR